MAGLRNGLRKIARDRNEWAGIPMPLDNTNLVIEPTYRWAKELAAIGAETQAGAATGDDIEEVNTWWSFRLHTKISLFREAGRIKHIVWPRYNRGDLLFNTLNAADAWGIEQEAAAVQTLGALLRHRQFKQYLMTGLFVERSRRSGISYMFRRLRPTLAISTRRASSAHILCALCLHPIAYYRESWAGAMCPTDDVIAHLMLMRGDEHMFWRRANQHPAWLHEAGI